MADKRNSFSKFRTQVLAVELTLADLISEYDLKFDIFTLSQAESDFTESLKEALVNERFEITGIYQQEPPGLSELEPDVKVILRKSGFDSLVTAKQALAAIQETIIRQKREHFTFYEIAAILAKQSNTSDDYLIEQQQKAFMSGKLVFFCNGSPVDPTTFNHPMGIMGFWDQYSTPKEINKWLLNWGAEYRFPTEIDLPEERPPSIREQRKDMIIKWLQETYGDLLSLPPPKQEGGPKKACKDYLCEKHPRIFTVPTFDYAWKRLSTEKRIKYSKA